MTRKRKLQVFVSSTFADLRNERQAAVEAILTAGHIPAGMELFTAGDESQMNVIKRWIDESDVYLLILGGRYGSIEPNSQKSYIHLEYDYAVEQQKPLFAVVIDEGYLKQQRVKELGVEVIELEHPQQLKEFRGHVLTKMVRFWSDARDIKLAILETMSEFERRPDLVGWISGSESINSGAVVEEIARLTKENSELRVQLSKGSTLPTTTYNGLTFEQTYQLLDKIPIDESSTPDDLFRRLQKVAEAFEHSKISLLHFLWLISGAFQDEQALVDFNAHVRELVDRLIELRFIEKKEFYHGLTSGAKEFLVRIRVEYDLSSADNLILRTWSDIQSLKAQN